MPGGKVQQTNDVRGTIVNKPEGMALWIVELPSFSGAYAKRAVVERNGKFTVPKVPFGNENHPDATFDVIGLLVPEGEYLPEMDDLKKIPKGQRIPGMTVHR